MSNGEKKENSKMHQTMRAIAIVAVTVAGLATGRLVVIASAQAEDPSEDGAGGSAVIATDAAETELGEALMELEGKATQDPGAALAAGWYTCDVHRTGPGWGNVYLRLSSSSFTQRWFRARDDQKKEMLAAGLTAISAGKKVSVYVTGTQPSPYGEIRACYVLN